jgi:hypothetical protein
MIRRLCRLIAVVACLVVVFGAADGQAIVRHSQLSCAPYDQLERQCRCRGSDGYLVAYGRRYCDRSLHATGWTPAGERWRDQTLVCLQRSLAREISRHGRCDCANVREIAWKSHVQCYTQAAASVCSLPLSDLLKIYAIIDSLDLLSPYGFSQMLAIMNVCAWGRH